MTGVPAHARGYERFPGVVDELASRSTPAWKRHRRARDGAPNIVVILIDDLGYSDIGPFGSEIPTPNLDRLAADGLRLTNYHTTPVCSPARAALLTGLNPHRAGFGSVANSDPGFPGLRLELDDDVVALPEVLREAGYATIGIGKWHLTRDATINAGAQKDSWPIQRGFDHYYGTLEGLNSFFHPNQLIRDNTPVQLEEFGPDYYLTDDYTEQALSLIKGLRAADADKPFFLYFAHTAMHGPIGATPENLLAQRGRYDEGWDVLRERRFARQLDLGLFPEGTPLAPRNGEAGYQVPAWADVDPEQRPLLARYMEAYAAMLVSVDQSVGRLLDLLDALGERENTIVVFTSDNGGTAEGGLEGTRSYFSRFVHIPGLPDDWEPDVSRDLDVIGGPRSSVHYPRGWGMVSNTPFRLYKANTHAGGVRVPFLVSWPARLDGDRGGLREQYQYVTDVLPTLLDLAGVAHPGQRHGRPAQEPDGVSFAEVLQDRDAPSTHPEQYSEFGGHRGFYRDGWKIVTLHQRGAEFSDAEWELYHVAQDPNELRDVAARHPDKVAELAQAWRDAAWANTVFPLIDSPGAAARRRPEEDALSRPVTLLPGTPLLERYRSAALTTLRPFTVRIDVAVADGDAGVLVAHGDQGGGYQLAVHEGRWRVAYNAYGELVVGDGGPAAPGRHEVLLVVEPTTRFRVAWTLTVDGTDVARSTQDLPMLVGMAPFTGISVGRDAAGPVDWALHEKHGSYPYSGALAAVRYEPGPPVDYDPAVLLALQADVATYYD